MSFFPEALEFTLAMEGGYVNHPNDKGGATNKGVTQAVYDAHRAKNSKPPQSVRLISDAEVQNIYLWGYWKPIPGIDAMTRESAMVLFDVAVNHGVGRAKQWLKAVGQDPKALIARRRAFYAAIVRNNPSQKVFERGWENRVKALERAVGLG